MINLLPPDLKESYRYGRHNRTLVRWAVLMGASLLVACALIGAGYLYLNQQVTTTQKQIDASRKQLESQDLSGTQKQVKNISNNLKLAVSVLSQEVLFSQLLKQLASVLPDNTVLTGLTISQAQAGVDLTAQTGNYVAATQLQVNLADPRNKIFSKADIVSINCTNSGGSNALSAKYPCTVSIRALFATNNPFLFINSKGAGR